MTFVVRSRFTMRAYLRAADLSPPYRRCGILCVPLPATGRGCASVLHVAAAGAWKESLDGSRSRRPGPTASGEAPAMAWSPLAAKGLKARPRSASDGASHGPKTGTGQKSPNTRAPQGRPGDPARSRGALPRGSRGGPAGSPGAGGKPAPGLPRGARVPVAPPAHSLETDGACAEIQQPNGKPKT